MQMMWKMYHQRVSHEFLSLVKMADTKKVRAMVLKSQWTTTMILLMRANFRYKPQTAIFHSLGKD